MRIRYISDLHLEKTRSVVRSIPRDLSCPLFLAGDIGNVNTQKYESFLGIAAEQSKHVFLIAGNHEYRRASSELEFQDIENKIDRIAKKIGNISFLNRNIIDYEEFAVAGATLWTNSADAPTSRLRLENERHLLDSTFIGETLKTKKPVIMMTHHLPSYQLITPYFANHPRWSAITYRWASHSDYLLTKPITAWICGHSHTNIQRQVGGVQILMAADTHTPHTYSI